MNHDPMMYDKSKYASMRYARMPRQEEAPPSCRPMPEDNCVCDSDRAVNFAAWELRLYLDTHPYDEKALLEYRKLCEALGKKCNYACHTGDAHGEVYRGDDKCGCDAEGKVWRWISDPWPWELAANHQGGGC